jgi:hypothetical protein
MSKKNVVRLLVRLFGEPAYLEKLRKNPGRTLAAAGITPAERELLLSGSDAKIRAYLGADSGRAAIKAKTVAIKGKTAAIKGKTAAIKGKTAAIKGKTAAIKTIAPAGGAEGPGGPSIQTSLLDDTTS